jgi:hypothetical protein
LLTNPVSTRPSYVGSLLFCCPQAFLTVMPRRAKKRQSAVRLPRIRFLVHCRNEIIQRQIRLFRNRGGIVSARSSNGEMLPPRGFGSEPSSRQRCSHLTAELAHVANCSAASRREGPASTRPMTRTHISPGYVARMSQPSSQINAHRLAPHPAAQFLSMSAHHRMRQARLTEFREVLDSPAILPALIAGAITWRTHLPAKTHSDFQPTFRARRWRIALR